MTTIKREKKLEKHIHILQKCAVTMLISLFLFLTGCGRKSASETEVQQLTLAVHSYGSTSSLSVLSQWVILQNEQHPNVQIELVNYAENYPDPAEAMNQIKIEIAAGKGPDMIAFRDSFYSPVDASSGILADLYPLMKEDASFDSRELYCNVLDSFAVGNSLYVLVPSFNIDSFATDNPALSGLESMNISHLVDAYNGLPDDSILFPGETKRDVLAMLCYGGLENYIDWEKGVCHFHDDSFQEVLKFANRFPLNLNISNDYSAKAFFTEGRALLYPVYISNVYEITKVRMLYGKMPSFIGYPVDSGNGNMAEIADIAIGISATCRHKEAAWAFLKSLVSAKFQDNVTKGLPIRIASLEQKLADAMDAKLDASGEKIVKDRILWEGEDPVNVYEISTEDAEALKTVIGKIEYNAAVDSAIYGIILEEADAMFRENRSANDVAEIIQNRANLYIHENR